jgi:hypothetical protein
LQFRMQEYHGIAILIILLSNWARISKMGAHFQTAVGPRLLHLLVISSWDRVLE